VDCIAVHYKEPSVPKDTEVMADLLPLNIDPPLHKRRGQDFSLEREESFEQANHFTCSIIGASSNLGSCTFLVGEEDSSVPPVNLKFQSPYNRRGWIANPPPCKFKEWEKDCEKFLRRFTEIKYHLEDNLDEYQEPFRTNLRKFIVSLFYYEKERNISDLSGEAILRGSLTHGPAYAKMLDTYRSAVIGKTFNLEYLSPEILEIKNTFLIPNIKKEKFEIGKLFRPNQLFNWDAPILDIRETCFDPVSISNETSKNFRLNLRKLLKNPRLDLLHEVKWTTLLNDNAKSTYDSQVYKEPVPKELPWKRGPSRLVNVPRELKEKRAACIEQYPSSLRIRCIEANVKQVLLCDKRSQMRHKPETIKLELEKALGVRRHAKNWIGGRMDQSCKYSTWSYCRDFKKEGLTKPRELLKIMLEELLARFPTWSCFMFPDFFSVWELHVGEEILFPLRGHGLGMANALTTLMQLVIEDMTYALCKIRPKWSGYYNDDATILFNKESDVRKYYLADKKVCEALSLAYKTKATFICKDYAVLCEQYAAKDCPYVSRKNLYALQELGLLLSAVNAAHAQSMARSMNMDRLPNFEIENIFQYWGWVLYRNEHKEPIVAGGWWRAQAAGIDTSFSNKQGCDKVPCEAIAAARAYHETKFNFKPWLKEKNYLSKRATTLDNDYKEFMGISNTNSNIDFQRPSMDSRNTTLAWIKYQERLRAAYKQCYRKIKIYTWEECYIWECNQNPGKDILPPKGSGSFQRCDNHTSSKDIIFHNPYSNYGELIDQEVFKENHRNEYCLKTNMSETLQLGFPHFNKDIRDSGQAANFRKFPERSFMRPKYYHVYTTPTEESMKYWHNPFHVQKVVDAIYPGGYYTIIPNCKLTEKEKLLNQRQKVYGKELSVSEWLEIGSLAPKDRLIIMMILDESNWSMLQDLCSTFRKIPGCGNFTRFQHGPMRARDIAIACAKWEAIVTKDYELLEEIEIPELDLNYKYSPDIDKLEGDDFLIMREERGKEAYRDVFGELVIKDEPLHEEEENLFEVTIRPPKLENLDWGTQRVYINKIEDLEGTVEEDIVYSAEKELPWEYTEDLEPYDVTYSFKDPHEELVDLSNEEDLNDLFDTYAL